MQKARGYPVIASYNMGLPQNVGTRFQVLFHSPSGVLFTFPSRYWFTIGRRIVFSLGRWSSQIPTGFHVPRGTRVSVPERHIYVAYGAITLYGRTFQTVLLYIYFVTLRKGCNPLRTKPTTPDMQRLQAYTYPV